MRLTENRTIAWIALALCVLVSVFGFGGMKLASERGKVMAVFENGAAATLSVRHSMDAYLDSAAESAQIMIAETELRMGSSEVTQAAAAQAAQVAGQENLDTRYQAYTDLKASADKLYNQLYTVAQGDAFNNFKLAYDDFWGYDDLIQRDEYHQLAKRYNRLAGGFPGLLVAKLLGQGALNSFGG